MAARRADRTEPGTAVRRSEGAPEPAGPDGRVLRFSSQDDLSLAVRLFDAPPTNRLPLICLPGLSRNSRDFIPLGQFAARHRSTPRKVFAVDYRGRGLSDRDPNWRNYTPVVEAQDIITAATVYGIERAILVGTSRGGIIAMLLGALHPTLIAGVVLNDIGPVIEGTGLARIKSHLSARRSVKSWEDAVAAVRATSGAQFPGLSDDDWRDFTAAYFVETRSRLVPAFDRNLIKTLGDFDLTEKIPVLWPQFMSLAKVPVLAIRGALSDVLSAQTFAAMAERHSRCEQITVEKQGHAPLLSDGETLERIAAFAARCDTSA